MKKSKFIGRKLILLLSIGLTFACSKGPDIINDEKTYWTWALPLGFPTPLVPKDNQMTKAKVDLGRFLFYDRKLSGNGTQSCGDCHKQERGFTDGLAVPIGSTGEIAPRNTQPLANVAYMPTLTWANPSLLSLEKQMEVPFFGDSPVELGVHDGNKEEILLRLSSDPLYSTKFLLAFPEDQDPIKWMNIIKAISSFQRSLISGNSKYDQFIAGKLSLTASESRGMNLFFGEKAECFHCHGSHNFNDQVIHMGDTRFDPLFHNTGLFNIGGTGAFPEPNRGLFEITGVQTDMGKFKAPSLRNIEVTGPYMHDGSMNSLEEVVEFYSNGGRNITSGPHSGDGRLNPNKSDLISQINLSEEEKRDLVSFMKTLTDHEFLTKKEISNPFIVGGP